MFISYKVQKHVTFILHYRFTIISICLDIQEPVHATFVLSVLTSNEGSGEFVLSRRLARAFCCSHTHNMETQPQFRPLALLYTSACAFIGYMRLVAKFIS